MKLKFLTSQINFDIEIWNLNQIQVKSWRFDLRFDSSLNLLTCQEFEFDSSSNLNLNLRFASRVKSTHLSLKLNLTINLCAKNVRFQSSYEKRSTRQTFRKINLFTNLFQHFTKKTFLTFRFIDIIQSWFTKHSFRS